MPSLTYSLPPLSANAALPLINGYEPENILAIHNGKQITQHQFLHDLHKVAAQLPSAGYALNLCEDRYYFLLAFCAVLMNGAVNLLPSNRQPTTLLELAQDYPGCYCLFDNEQVCELSKVSLSDFLQYPIALDDIALPAIPAQQIAAIAFTSGSTGKPKPNAKAWGTLAATARLLGQKLTAHLTQPIIVATVPSQHMYGLETTLMMALQAGAIMHSAKPFFPADVQQLLLQLNAPSILVSAPIHLRALVQAELAMPPLAGIISATAPLDLAIAEKSEAVFSTELWEIYGCTEAGSMATRRSTATPAWQLLAGFSLAETATGFTASAPHLSEIAPLQDQLELNHNGEFLLCGRNADMINVAGKRASLAHLTLQLLRVDGVKDGVIFLPQPQQNESRPVALVVSDLPEKQILAALAEYVDAAFLPRPLRKIAALPRTETGKLTATVLQQLWEQVSDKH